MPGVDITNRRAARLLLLSAALHLGGFIALHEIVQNHFPTLTALTDAARMDSGPLDLQWGTIRKSNPKNSAPQPLRENQPSEPANSVNSNKPDLTAGKQSGNSTDKPSTPSTSNNSHAGAIAINSADPYYSEVRARIQSHIHYPPAIARKRIQGQVQVALTLLANGSIQSVEISRSSGSSDLDQLALRSVQAAAPFPAFQTDASSVRKLELPIDFRLR